MKQEYYSFAEAAKILKVSVQAIYKRADSGTLKTERIGSHRVVTKEALEQLKAER